MVRFRLAAGALGLILPPLGTHVPGEEAARILRGG
jgi:hypothetical protein